jgi:hypothetical protein
MVFVAVSCWAVETVWRRDGHMNIWVAAMLLGGLAIVAITAVIITNIALRDAASEHRASIVHAIAELVRALHR